MARRVTSGIWKHFSVNAANESKACCKICEESVSRGGRSAKSYNTSNLPKHMMMKHPEQYTVLQKEVEEQAQAKAKLLANKKQPTIAQVLESGKPYAFDHPRARQIHRLIGEMIAVDNEPFSIVHRVGFKRLMNSIEPRYSLPSDRYFSDTLIPEMYAKVKEKVTSLIKEQGHVSITTDLWSSIAQDSYLSLTAHFINSNHERQQACLHAVPFDGSHTGERIASMITNCLQAWGIAEKLHVVVHDNGSNFVAGLREGNVPNIPCLAHKLQLVMKDGCLAQPCVSALTAMARNY